MWREGEIGRRMKRGGVNFQKLLRLVLLKNVKRVLECERVT